MTVHWNFRKGFGDGVKTTSTGDDPAERQSQKASVAELLWSMRKTPDVRSSVVTRGRRLLSDPDYPSRDVLRRVAGVLARHLKEPGPDQR